MQSKLGIYWAPRHQGEEDFEFFAAMRPKSILVMDGSEDLVRRAYQASPDSLFVIRDWALSEQKDDIRKDPEGTGKRHAGEMFAVVTKWASFVPRGQIMALADNEPDVNPAHEGAIALVNAYNAALLDEATRLGLAMGAGKFSVGWPHNTGTGKPPAWDQYMPMLAAIRRGYAAGVRHRMILHEYWDKNGPDNAAWWGWRTGRYLWLAEAHPDIEIYIGEFGLDQYVNDPQAKETRGYKHYATDAQYMYQAAFYDWQMQHCSQIHSGAWFLYDVQNREWNSFDWRGMKSQVLEHVNSVRSHSNNPSPRMQITGHTPPPAPVVSLRYPLPVGKGRLTQIFGVNAADYARFGLKGHNGLDWGVDVGTPVLAAAVGTVREAQYDPDGFGNYVKLIHAWGETLYAHLSYIAVNVGATVGVGNQIGLSGNTGNSTGPHLHFGVRVNPYNRADGWAGYSDPARWLAAEVPVVDVTDRIRDAAWVQLGIPRNTDAALYRAAQAAKLGRPVTAEFNWNGYRAQGYDGGVVYCAIGDWGNVKTLAW